MYAFSKSNRIFFVSHSLLAHSQEKICFMMFEYQSCLLLLNFAMMLFSYQIMTTTMSSDVYIFTSHLVLKKAFLALLNS